MSIAFGSNKLIVNGDMSSNINSDSINLTKKEGLSIQAIYTGSPVGTLSVHASIDGVNFTEITGTSLAITESGDVLYNFREINYLFAKVVWIFTSGTGNLNVFFSSKEDE